MGRAMTPRRLVLTLTVAAWLGLTASMATAATGGAAPSKKPAPRARAAAANPFATRGMWIWYVSQSNGGNLSSLIATAHRYGISTLFIKSGDGSALWSQFSSSLVNTLHAHGLRVCAWQYVYGSYPLTEAQVGATAVHRHADCLAIDAESEYEGRYVSAQSYIRRLRQLVGSRFPIALASFPYVDYHPGFPYSVFMGPNGAQYNVPQMYWRDIGVSVDTVYAHTYAYNRIYGRAIFPLGQIYSSPPASQIKRFRQLARVYGAGGLSWWDWQEAAPGAFSAVAAPVGVLLRNLPGPNYASIARGAHGDLVVWAQEHLVGAGQKVTINGTFGPATTAAVMSFQLAHGLPPVGVIGPQTWPALLRYRPATVTWTASGARASAASKAGGVTPVPASARLPAVRDEIGRSHGRG